ncbi:hypothetical protein Pfo_020518 [Paulownia fortunei]|nr:hypothetical protein Pfo_020518 [Paulownia fortunei]
MNSPPTPVLISLSFSPKISLSLSLLFFPSLEKKTHHPQHSRLWICVEQLETRKKMNKWAYQQKALVGGCVADGVVCPKPRRIGAPLHFHESMRPPSRLLHINNQQAEACDAKAGTELLDIIRMKGSYGSERSNFHVASSPPFFIGSPPSRASNPIVQDEQFGNDNGNPFSPMLEAPSSTRKSGGCVRVNFAPKPAPVRIEGFNCRGNCSISAVA